MSKPARLRTTLNGLTMTRFELPDLAELNRLSEAAYCIDNDDWNSERQIKAFNLFKATVSTLLTQEECNSWDDWCLTATSDSAVTEGMRRVEQSLMVKLISEYTTWYTEQGLSRYVAASYDHANWPNLTDEQRAYLRDFNDRRDRIRVQEELSATNPRPRFPNATDNPRATNDLLAPISKLPEQDQEASELDNAEEVLRVELPADEETSAPLDPGSVPGRDVE